MTAVKQEEEKEFVSLYLPASIAKQVKALKDGEALQEELIAYVEKTRKDFRSEVSGLDEDVLIFKAQVYKAKEALKSAYETYSAESYQLWENATKDIASTKQFVDLAVGTLAPFKRELQEVNSLMQSIDKWDIEKLIDLLKQLATADSESREMLRFLFENFKREAK